VSGHKPFSALNTRENYYVKAFYYALGHNDLVDAINNQAFTATMKVDAIEFADLYYNQFQHAKHVINIQDCLKMYLGGKRVFERGSDDF